MKKIIASLLISSVAGFAAPAFAQGAGAQDATKKSTGNISNEVAAAAVVGLVIVVSNSGNDDAPVANTSTSTSTSTSTTTASQ
jgi:hypothetical protein